MTDQTVSKQSLARDSGGTLGYPASRAAGAATATGGRRANRPIGTAAAAATTTT